VPRFVFIVRVAVEVRVVILVGRRARLAVGVLGAGARGAPGAPARAAPSPAAAPAFGQVQHGVVAV